MTKEQDRFVTKVENGQPLGWFPSSAHFQALELAGRYAILPLVETNNTHSNNQTGLIHQNYIHQFNTFRLLFAVVRPEGLVVRVGALGEGGGKHHLDSRVLYHFK